MKVGAVLERLEFAVGDRNITNNLHFIDGIYNPGLGYAAGSNAPPRVIAASVKFRCGGST
jgi:hypothetical protein